MFPVLSIITFMPLLGVLILVFISDENRKFIKNFTLCITLLVFLVSIYIYFHFDPQSSDMQFSEKIPWIEEWNVTYAVGIDGISLFLVLLTTFLMPIAVLASYSAIEKRMKEYMIFMLLLETGMLGVFISLDLFLFYIFWEVMLIPMYFLIGVWGGSSRIYAAIKFFLYTMAGSVLMLLGILYIYFYAYEIGPGGEHIFVRTFDLLTLFHHSVHVDHQYLLFLAFGLAFAIKVPMFPFHTWLPDAHVEAPTAGSVLLAAVLLKMGTYGFIRFAMPLFPVAAEAFLPYIMLLAVAGIIYGAWVSMVQPDLKKLVAYSSVSHLGFVILGLFARNLQSLEGGILQMINHGISTGALFLIVGMIYERRHTRLISDFGGISSVMPVFAVFFMIVTLSSIALPGTNGFIGEFMIILGAFKTYKLYAVLAASGVIFAAVYMLRMFQKVMFGKVIHEENKTLKDLCPREVAILIPIVVMIFWIGLYPVSFLGKMETSVDNFMKIYQRKYQAYKMSNLPESVIAGIDSEPELKYVYHNKQGDMNGAGNYISGN